MLEKKKPNLFVTNNNTSDDMSVVLRGRNNLRVSAHGLSFYRKGPCYMVIRTYRSLPNEVAQINNTNDFRKADLPHAKTFVSIHLSFNSCMYFYFINDYL